MLCKIKWPTLISNPRKIMQNTFCFLFLKKKKIKKEQPRMKGFLKKKKNYKTQTILLVRQRLKLI